MKLNYNAKLIRTGLSLRPPQAESLERFQEICDLLSLSKDPDLEAELQKMRELVPTLTSFEREFPSVCFALATGIGKTRLMGAFIAYLHYEKGISNFFVMAPNLTIYDKLKQDLGQPNSSKYVFAGLDRFTSPPRIIDGENYEEFRLSPIPFAGSFGHNDIIINIFNISKLNAETRVGQGRPARVKRVTEVLGQSYFSYLQNLPDLCIMMDESHHYHADRSFEVINELKPVLGVEFTATPQVQSGSRKIDFKNVVYEYSLAHALNDGLYVKIPVVVTRKDFKPEQYTPEQLDQEKLNDGIRIHEETKSRLDVYARSTGNFLVKPFVLVVAKDMEHSSKIREYLTSDRFLRGYYQDKVLEINSAQRGLEKDANIQQLLSLEDPDNKIEIVVHVNMLKEGWDVTNLYTIIPLRASASETLTEQTIGRGLRLPYGQRTGVDEIDRLSIVSHDRYEAIVNLASDPNSLVRRIHYIEPEEADTNDVRETIELPSTYDEMTGSESLTKQLILTFQETAPTFTATQHEETTRKVAQFVADLAAKTVIELGKQVKTFDVTKDEQAMKMVHSSVISTTIQQFPTLTLKAEDLNAVVNKAIATCVQTLTNQVIPIPQAVIQPFTATRHGFHPFTLNTRNIGWHPADDTLIGTELQEGGQTFEYEALRNLFPTTDTVENEIVRHIIVQDNIDYETSRELMYSLVHDAKQHFLSYLTVEETERVMRQRQKNLAELIYAQMNEHFYQEVTDYRASEMRPFSRIETGFAGKFRSDDLYDLTANLQASEVKNKVFKGFKKACHTLYKFDSNPERMFARVLENDSSVLKWMRPSPKQFNLYYGPSGTTKYEPDFIVEITDKIYMVEVKAAYMVATEEVQQKAQAALEYCRAATEWNLANEGKAWEYALLSHDVIHLNSSFEYLIKNQAWQRQGKLLLD